MSRIAQTAVYDVLTTNVISILPRIDTGDLPPVQGSIAYDVTDDSIRYSDGTRWLRVYPLEGDVTIDSNGDTLVSSIQGNSVGPFSSISAGDVMTWNGTTWVNSPVPSGGTPGGPAGGELSGIYPNPALATTSVTPGSYGSATQVGTFTVDSKGRLTSAGNVSISVPPSGAAGGDLTGTYPNPTLIASGVTPGSYISSNVTVNSKGIITSISSGIIEHVVDIDSATAATITHVVGAPVLAAPPVGSYYLIDYVIVEYHYNGSAWVQADYLKLYSATPNGSSYLAFLEMQGTANVSRCLSEDANNGQTYTTESAIELRSYTSGNLWSSASGSTFVRIRLFYKVMSY